MDNPLTNSVAEKDVLSALLADRSAIVPVVDVISPDDFQDERHQKIARTIWNLYEDHEVINQAMVLSRLPDMDRDYVASLAQAATQKAVVEVEWNAYAVYRAAVMSRISGVASEIQFNLVHDEIDDPSVFIEESLVKLASIQDSVIQRDASSETITKTIVEGWGQPVRSWSTGLGWLDKKTGGFIASTVWVLAAPYKMRKSTLVRNWIIAVCRQGASFDWFNLERRREYHVACLVAMIVNQKLYHAGRAGLVTEQHIMSGVLDESQKKLVHSAIEEVNSWKIRIYDGRDGIANVDKCIAIIRRNRVINGLDMFALDHLQRLEGKQRESLYERMSYAATRLANVIVTTQVCGILVSQMDNSSIRTYGEESGPFVGAKGSGDIPAAADNVVMTTYDPEQSPGVLGVSLKISRDTGPGKEEHKMEQTSGLLLDLGSGV